MDLYNGIYDSVVFNMNEYLRNCPLISVIIPIYNEQDTIGEVLSRVLSLQNELSLEIVVIDDGSIDDTVKVIRKYPNILLIKHEKNFGKGAAIITGMNKSRGEIVIIQDADLEYLPKDIPKIINPIINGEADVVFGSRFLGKIDGMSYSHFLGNKILSIVAQILYKSNITDIMTGYKAMTRNVVNNLDLKEKGFEVEIEMTSNILKKGYRLIEVPISYRYRTSGKSKITFLDGLNSLIYLIARA